jgi:hypothetical protein
MNRGVKQRVLAAQDRANLMAALAGRGFYVIGEMPAEESCGQRPVTELRDRPDESSVGKRTQEPQTAANGS